MSVRNEFLNYVAVLRARSLQANSYSPHNTTEKNHHKKLLAKQNFKKVTSNYLYH